MKSLFYFDVRGYELDSLGHVNNSIYANYYEHARWKSFNECNIINYLVEHHLHIIVTEAKIRYLAELKVFDKAVVESIFKIEGNFIVANQSIFLCKNQKRISKSKIKHLIVDTDRIVYDIPPFIRETFNDQEIQKPDHNSLELV
ncbi:MAG: acyl-CoA thioesterase [Proteobacteria bacterium]|nr:acyl-CoA thioesterase [Pseudomonadota bacterium]MBU1585639.1 acyl-CoA thioesterase [Pseudomonadota bacterium]MBU2629637.1 acyl-CoA thioesterase [Pseudomonadota bacterium]